MNSLDCRVASQTHGEKRVWGKRIINFLLDSIFLPHHFCETRNPIAFQFSIPNIYYLSDHKMSKDTNPEVRSRTPSEVGLESR